MNPPKGVDRLEQLFKISDYQLRVFSLFFSFFFVQTRNLKVNRLQEIVAKSCWGGPFLGSRFLGSDL